jgi:hypothetical protein
MYEELLQLILGPFGALATMAVVLFGIYNMVVKHLLPLTKSALDRHLSQVETIIEEHKKDRELYRESILIITQRLDKVEDDVAYIKGKLDGKEEKE